MYSAIVKKTVALLLAFAVSGCSALPLDFSLLTPSTPLPTDTPRPTVTRFPSPTATQDLFALKTEVPTNILPAFEPGGLLSRTPSPTHTPRPTITIETLDPSLNTPSARLFQFVQRSTDQLVWGGDCDGDRSILFVANVTPVRRLRYVLLYYRLQDKFSGRNSGWMGGAIMRDNDQGKYFYKLELYQITGHDEYEDAWLQYQLVASTAALDVLSRTVVDHTSVSITRCSALGR
jgi:hypothetical protein